MQALQLLQLLLQLLRLLGLRGRYRAGYRCRIDEHLPAWLRWRHLLRGCLLLYWLLLQECLQLWQRLQERQRECSRSRRRCRCCWGILRRSVSGLRCHDGIPQGLCLLSRQAASQQGGCSGGCRRRALGWLGRLLRLPRRSSSCFLLPGCRR